MHRCDAHSSVSDACHLNWWSTFKAWVRCDLRRPWAHTCLLWICGRERGPYCARLLPRTSNQKFSLGLLLLTFMAYNSSSSASQTWLMRRPVEEMPWPWLFTNQVKPQLDLLRYGHELRPAGVHRWLRVAAIGTTVWMSALSFATERASPGARVVSGMLLLRLVRAMVLGH